MTEEPELELTIMLPAYREAEALDLLLPGLKRVAAQLAPAHEILVIDSQSPLDRTPEVCRTHQVVHVSRQGGNAYGDAVRTGIRAARGRYILTMDADGSHNPDFLSKLWDQREQCDIVIGSRYVSGGGTENPWVLIFLSYLVNMVFRVVLGLRCHDVSNSLRLYRREHLRDLQLRATDFDIIEEILVKLCSGTRRCRVLEVPIVFERRKAGQSKRNLVWFALGYLFTLGRLLRFKIAARVERG
ncbi:MAG: glycosyltransferase [Pirellulaceae bacterium]|nr:glycosyltransferase [Pirellulaceae bacterium]